MANTTTQHGNFIEITPDGATDWSAMGDIGHKLKLSAIQFNPSAANDVLIIRENGIDSAAIFNATAVGSAQVLARDYTHPKWCNPTIDASDCTFGTAGNVRILLEIE